ncbi:MAG: hypothetical protein H6851_04730 [Geminicoccaceae bacterium]|nr:hypothetical protein [Geminicoccaceae bacterium]
MNTHHAVANELDPSASDDLANDNLRHEGQPHAMTGQEEAIISAAVLVATAFQLRDEEALIQTLRKLADEVDNLRAD